MLMNSRGGPPSSWWNLDADPLWLMNSTGGPLLGGTVCWWILEADPLWLMNFGYFQDTFVTPCSNMAVLKQMGIAKVFAKMDGWIYRFQLAAAAAVKSSLPLRNVLVSQTAAFIQDLQTFKQCKSTFSSQPNISQGQQQNLFMCNSKNAICADPICAIALNQVAKYLIHVSAISTWFQTLK